MKVKVKVDRLICISLASCTVMSPTIFKLDDTGKAIIHDDLAQTSPQVHSVEKKEETDDTGTNHFVWYIDADDDWVNANLMPGAQACPVTAIHIWETDTNKQLYPAA